MNLSLLYHKESTSLHKNAEKYTCKIPAEPSVNEWSECTGSHEFSLKERVLLEVERVKNRREPFFLKIRVSDREKTNFQNGADCLPEKLKHGLK